MIFLVKICKNCGLNFYAKIQINRESKRLDIFDDFQPLWVTLFISDCTAPFIVSIMTNSGQSTMPQPVQDRGKNLQKNTWHFIIFFSLQVFVSIMSNVSAKME